MIEKIKYLFAGALALSTTAFVACDDDNTSIDEFEATYVYLARPTLGTEVLSYTVKHMGDNIIGKVEIPIVVRVSKPQATAVEVELIVKSKTDFGQSLVSKSGQNPTIPAGEMMARDTLIVSNWNFALEMGPSTLFEAAISIGKIHPSSEVLRISTKQNLLSIQLNKGKRINSNVLPNQTPEGAPLDRANWTVTMSKNANEINWVAADELKTDGNIKMLYNIAYVGYTIDLGAAQTLTGLKTSGGKWYACTSCCILTSDDGITWTLQSDDTVNDVVKDTPEQFFSFSKPVTTRYIRWRMYRNKESVGSCELQAYSK